MIVVVVNFRTFITTKYIDYRTDSIKKCQKAYKVGRIKWDLFGYPFCRSLDNEHIINELG